jgi:CRP/FNR family cyclic AMP-dependent transcriptional regulator
MSATEPRVASGASVAAQELQELIVDRLPGCRPPTIRALRKTARLQTVPARYPIYRQGEPVLLTLILRGYGAARRTTVDGQQFTSGVARAGDLFGFSGIASTQSSVELVALTDCEVAQWAGPEVRALASVDPGLALAAIDSMAASLHVAMERVEGFLHQDARRRVLRILARERVLFFGEPAVLTRSHLPGLVGTSREMTGRVLRQLEREGTLARVGQVGLRLLRPDRLDADPA